MLGITFTAGPEHVSGFLTGAPVIPIPPRGSQAKLSSKSWLQGMEKHRWDNRSREQIAAAASASFPMEQQHSLWIRHPGCQRGAGQGEGMEHAGKWEYTEGTRIAISFSAGRNPSALKSLPVHPKMGNPAGIAGWEHQGCFRLRLRQGLSHSSRNSQVGRAGNIHRDKEAAMSSPSQTTAIPKGGRRRMETPGKILHSHIRMSPSTASQEQHSSRTWSFPEQQLLEHGRAASRDLGTASCQEQQLHLDPSNYS